MALKAHEHPLKKIFSSDFDFVIPYYQRPYAWGSEETLQLLDDLDKAIDRDTEEPYFLGSLVLVQESEDTPVAEVIDGQQRLTTLSILFAVLRDLATNDETATVLRDMVLEPGVALDGIPPKPRLRLRQQDADFFKKYVQKPDRLTTLFALADHALTTDSQKAIRDNANELYNKLSAWRQDRRDALASLARIRTFLVVVSTPSLTSAHRIFSVMNDRGRDLEPSDIFKADVIGKIPPGQQEEYAAKWETAEQNLGREVFAELFLHIRTIFTRTRAQRELLIEFPQQVLNNYLDSDRAKAFIDDLLLPYADAYGHLINRDLAPDLPEWQKVDTWLERLGQLDNNDWRPAALWALKHHSNNADFLAKFLRKLERLGASMLLRRIYTTPRVTRYLELLRQLEAGHGLHAAAFELDAKEKRETRNRLDGELYLVDAVRKYVLLRLDALIADDPGAQYSHRRITVEHVLPQNPNVDSEWMEHFTEAEREHWTHRIGNLLLLNRTKNSQAQNYDFDKKKGKYFLTGRGSAVFALTTQVLSYPEWTPAVVEERQAELTKMLNDEWELN